MDVKQSIQKLNSLVLHLPVRTKIDRKKKTSIETFVISTFRYNEDVREEFFRENVIILKNKSWCDKAFKEELDKLIYSKENGFDKIKKWVSLIPWKEVAIFVFTILTQKGS